MEAGTRTTVSQPFEVKNDVKETDVKNCYWPCIKTTSLNPQWRRKAPQKWMDCQWKTRSFYP